MYVDPHTDGTVRFICSFNSWFSCEVSVPYLLGVVFSLGEPWEWWWWCMQFSWSCSWFIKSSSIYSIFFARSVFSHWSACPARKVYVCKPLHLARIVSYSKFIPRSICSLEVHIKTSSLNHLHIPFQVRYGSTLRAFNTIIMLAGPQKEGSDCVVSYSASGK